jgi:erythromycin esterase
MSMRLAIALLATLALATPPITGARQQPAPCDPDRTVELSVTRAWHGTLAPDQVQCLAVLLETGEGLRAVVEVDQVRWQSAGGTIELFAPGAAVPALRTGLGNVSRRPITWVAGEAAAHHVVLSGFWELAGGATGVPVRVWVEAVETPAQVSARRDAIAADPRVARLADRAWPLRTLDGADDDDFADLEPLRAALDGVRVVLLGESTHSSGADFRAFSRLTRFLHQELGFGVFALEAGMYGMQVAWDSMRAGAPPRESFVRGAFGFLSESEQMQPLIQYLGEQSRGGAPLELAGFDNRPWLFWPDWSVSLPQFADDLARVLTAHDVASPLAHRASPESRTAERLATRAYYRADPLPDAPARTAFLEAVDHAAATLAARDDDEARHWAEALRGVGCHAREVFLRAADAPGLEPACLRDAVMARHLLWLANERYPDRKIIAWTHVAHALRTPDLVQAGGTGPALGHGVWEALGEESFVIGTASYEGHDRHIVTDQHPSPEFEELMAAAGFDHALVNLRAAAREGSWLGGPFLARPNDHRTAEARWSALLDALLFIRVQERSRPYGQSP